MEENEGEALAAMEGTDLPIPKAEDLLVAPYTSEKLNMIQTFFKKRNKNPIAYTFTEEGDLETKEGATTRRRAAGEAGGTIQLKKFVALEAAERDTLEQARLEALSVIEEQFEEAMQKLKGAWVQYRINGSMRGVLEANQRLADLDSQRSMIRTPVRFITTIENPSTKSILLEETHETRKLAIGGEKVNEVYRLAFYNHLPEHEFGKYLPDEEATEEEIEEASTEAAILPEEASYRKRLVDGRVARLFYDIDAGKASDVNATLCPSWPVRFTMEGVEYAFALQAYEVERAKQLKKSEMLRKQLLGTLSAKRLRILMRSVKEHPTNAKEIWFRIYSAIYQQNPGLKESLLKTGTDTLVYADPQDGPSGVGLQETDIRILDPKKWRGENAVGTVQEEIRLRFREETLGEAPKEEDVREAAITEEQQQKARVGAIINAARRRRGA